MAVQALGTVHGPLLERMANIDAALAHLAACGRNDEERELLRAAVYDLLERAGGSLYADIKPEHAIAMIAREWSSGNLKFESGALVREQPYFYTWDGIAY